MAGSEVKNVFIVGPTASGKSALALWLAKYHGNAEIICADSQTVRKGMDIGTAKPSASDQAVVKHHCLDIVGPYDEFSLHDFLGHARRALDEIHEKGKLAIVVGGSGLYVDGLYFGFELPELSLDHESRRAEYEELSLQQLQDRLRADNIALPENAQNKRHLINALLREGRKGVRRSVEPSSYIIGLSPEREALWNRLLARTEAMFQAGFVDEVRTILERYGKPPRSFDAIAYRIVMRYIAGEIDEQATKELIHIAERQYAKRQMTWFIRNQDISWFTDVGEAQELLKHICVPQG